MPRGDRTGPLGFGPRTGRGAGYCSGYGYPGYVTAGGGAGFLGGGFGGRGYRNRYHAYGFPPAGPGRFFFTPPLGAPAYGPEQEREVLEDEIQLAEKHLADLKKRFEEINKKEME